MGFNYQQTNKKEVTTQCEKAAEAIIKSEINSKIKLNG